MKIATICFCLKENEVLLAMKKRGFGAGKWNGFGGKVKEGEQIKSTATREIFEEAGLQVEETALQQFAKIQFYFESEPVFECHVFIARQWEGEAKESEEMRPQWHFIDKLPFDEMWAADCQWMPLILSGKKIEAVINFNSDGSLVKDFSWKEVEFD